MRIAKHSKPDSGCVISRVPRRRHPRHPLAASLTGNQETPPTGSTAVGSAQLFLDGAKVLDADLPATNGYIHVIDEVLMS